MLGKLAEGFYNNSAVTPTLVLCFGRLQKLCWFDEMGQAPEKAVIQEVMPFLTVRSARKKAIFHTYASAKFS